MLIFLSVPPLDPFVDAPSASADSGGAAETPSLAPIGGTPLRACLVTPSGYQGAPPASGSHRHHGMVDTKNLAEHAAHFADRGVGIEGRAHQRQQVVSALSAGAQRIQRRAHGG